MRNAVSSIAVLLFGIILLEAPVYALLYDFEDKAQMDEWTVTDGVGKIENGVFILEKAGGYLGTGEMLRLTE